MIQPSEPILLNVSEGLHAGALDAIKKARQTHTKLVVWRDGKILKITADEAEAMIKKDKQ